VPDLDIVFVIDQSTTMVKINDPQNADNPGCVL